MKKFNKVLNSIIITSLVLFISCNVEPYEGPIPSPNDLNVTGINSSYILTAVNTSVATDLNGNGNPSTNQMNETACYNNNIITLKTDGTFTSNDNGVEINQTVTPNTIVCYSDPLISGTWIISGSNLSLSYNNGTTTVTDVFTIEGNTIKIASANVDIVSVDGAGNPVYVEGDIQAIYTKQ